MKQPTETIKVISAPMPERRRTNKSKELDEKLLNLPINEATALKDLINTRGSWYARAARLGIKVKVRSISPTHVGVWRVG